MIEEILDSMAPQLAVAGVHLDRGRTVCTVYRNRGAVKSSLVAFVFSGPEEAPRLVVKLSRQRETLERERRALQRISLLLPARVPRVLGFGETRGVGYLAMDSIDAAGIAPERFERHAPAALTALAEVHARSVDGPLAGAERHEALERPLREFSGWSASQAPELGPLAATLESALAGLEEVGLPRVPQHGDFVLSNLLYRSGAPVVIIDWEEFGTVTVPGYDLTVLFATLTGRSALGEPRLRRLFAEAWRRYSGELRLDPRWLPVLVPLHLILFFQFCLAERRDTPARMLLSQLRQWAEGRGAELWE